jgi:hypothetical protein
MARLRSRPGWRWATLMPKEQIVRTYYSGYDKKDWNLSGGVLAESFTFTSPNGDDHISKSVFKERCFLSQLDFIKKFELENDTSSWRRGIRKVSWPHHKRHVVPQCGLFSFRRWKDHRNRMLL